MKKHFLEIKEKQSTEEGTKFVAIASTSKEDRHGEVVSPDGWDFKDYKKNPVILWAHDHSIPAIGKATKVWVEGTGKRAKLMFEGVLHGIGEMASVAKALVDNGTINSFSVGFIANEMEGNEFTSQELLEISLVNVPANAQAQITAFKSAKDAGIDEKEMTTVGINVPYIELKQEVGILNTKMDTVVKGLEGLNPSKGRQQDIIESKIALSKVVARATDKILEEKHAVSRDQMVKSVKVIKRANEKLTVALKKDLTNGKN